MEFYLAQVQKFVDGSAQANALFAYDSLDKAMIAYHATLASARSLDNTASILAMVINEHGGTEIREYWEREIEPEPES